MFPVNRVDVLLWSKDMSLGELVSPNCGTVVILVWCTSNSFRGYFAFPRMLQAPPSHEAVLHQQRVLMHKPIGALWNPQQTSVMQEPRSDCARRDLEPAALCTQASGKIVVINAWPPRSMTRNVLRCGKHRSIATVGTVVKDGCHILIYFFYDGGCSLSYRMSLHILQIICE